RKHRPLRRRPVRSGLFLVHQATGDATRRTEGHRMPATDITATDRPYLRIAVEEAYAPTELIEEYRRLLTTGGADRGFRSLSDYSVRELRRAVTGLGLRGVIVNSHTRGEYLYHPKFEEFWATAAALDVPVYLHPNTPSDGLIGPLLDSGLDGAIYGFAVETGMH